MDNKIRSYYRLKHKHKEIEQELAKLREEILLYCAEQSTKELTFGKYVVKVVTQQRKEYDENKLFEALPDLELWRLLSSPDIGKIANLVKLNVISDEQIKDTYERKEVSLLKIERK